MKETITEAWLARTAPSPTKPAVLPEGTAQARYWDRTPGYTGFGVVIGKRFATFVVQHRVNGRQCLRTIGRYGHAGAGDDYSDAWTVVRARKEARRLLGSMEQGVDPKPVASQEPTLRLAFETHIDKLEKKVKGGKRSAATVETFRKSMAYVEAWLDRPLSELDGEALNSIYEGVKRNARARQNSRNERGAPLANRVITNVGTAWSSLNRKLGGKLGTWNPAKSVEKETLVPKRSRLSDEELPGWLARVATMRNPIQQDGLVFALFTGLRSEDVRSIRFEHVDIKARTVRLPDPKGGESRAFTIPLPQRCIDIIERRAATNGRALGRDDGDHGWVFPGVASDGDVGAISDLRQQMHDGDKHSRFPVEDVHTLRRTYTSIAQEAGISELDQHVLTNHRFGTGNVHQTYVSQHIGHLTICQDLIARALETKLGVLGVLGKRTKPTKKRVAAVSPTI